MTLLFSVVKATLVTVLSHYFKSITNQRIVIVPICSYLICRLNLYETLEKSLMIENDFYEKKFSRTCFANQALSTNLATPILFNNIDISSSKSETGGGRIYIDMG